MITFNWKLVTITVLYLYWFEVRADRRGTLDNLNKLVYWQRDPSLEDTRRLQKKKTIIIKPTETYKSITINSSPTQTYRKRVKADNIKYPTPIPKDLNDKTPAEKEERLDEYLSPYAIVPQITKILSEFAKINVTTEILGRTAEYNDIVLFKISSTERDSLGNFRANVDSHKYDDTNPEKKIIFIVHGLTVMGMHWLACLSRHSKLKILLGYYLEHLDKFDIYLIPMANPDGYVTIKSLKMYMRFWNKNMSPQADCRGVMLDRNFDIAWNNSHEMSSCSQAFPGPNPFSEIESKAISNVFHHHGHRILAYIHVHAGTYDASTVKGDAVLYPRGHTDIAGDDDKYFDIKGDIEESLRNASFRALSVTVDTLNHWYGTVTGTSVDYADQVFGIAYAMEFVMQLYPNSLNVFEDDENLDYFALTEIWKRVISVVFRNLAKSIDIVKTDEK